MELFNLFKINKETLEILKEINERLKRIEEAQKAVSRNGRKGSYIATGHPN